MFFFTGKTIDVNKIRIGVTSVFSSSARCKIVFFIAFIFLTDSVSGQCPDQDYFKQKIISIYRPNAKNIALQLTKLLQLQRQMKNCNYQNDSVFMYAQRAISFMYYKRDHYDSAIYFTNQSIIIGRKLLQENKCRPLALIHSYYNLYFFYSVLQQEQNKFKAIDSCIAYFLKDTTGFKEIVLPILAKVKYLFNKGDYSQCIKAATLGEEIVQNNGYTEDSASYIADFVVKRANALYYADERDSAKKILKKKILEFEKAGKSNQLGNIFSLLGLISKDEGKYIEALYFLKKGFEKFAVNKYDKGCAQNLAFIGGILGSKLGHYDEGLNYLSASLKYADANDSSYVFRQRGKIYSLKNKFDSAQYFFQEAYNMVQPGMDENLLLQNSFQFPGFNQLQELSDLTTDKGDAFLRQYYVTKNNGLLKKAISVHKKNDSFLAKIKTEQRLQFASSLVWSSTARSLYEHAIDACNANRNIEDAFYFFEKSRAILLNDQVNEQRWMANADIANQAVLKKNIIDLNLKLNSTTPSSDEHLKIQKDLYLKNQQLDILTDSIKNKNPLYYKNYLDTSFISVSQLRKNILGHSQSLIEIFSGDSAIYILIITNSNQSLAKINKQLYDSLASAFNSFVSNPERLNKDFKGWINISHQLYTLVFRKNIVPDGGFIISPDGINYPFEALVVNGTQEPDYFLNHYATSYTYSAKYLTNEFAKNTSVGNSIFGIAPVKYNNGRDLAPLTGSDNSLKNIETYFSNAANYVLEKATKNNFLQNFPDYNIVQLYTHASDNSDHNDPVIYFSDSALYLSSLLPDRKPVTQLVVLSACETANGKFYQGEGIFSFNRGFAALGIPAAVSNLWSVENESTYRITELFYKYLSKGLPTDMALQKAKLEFINKSVSKEKKLPYFWAGAILTGRVDTFKSNYSLPWFKITIVLIVLLGVTFLIGKVLLKKKVSQNM